MNDAIVKMQQEVKKTFLIQTGLTGTNTNGGSVALCEGMKGPPLIGSHLYVAKKTGPTCEEKEEEEAGDGQLRRNAPQSVACAGGLPLQLHLVSWAESCHRSASMIYPTQARLLPRSLCCLLDTLASAGGHSEPHTAHSTPAQPTTANSV